MKNLIYTFISIIILSLVFITCSKESNPVVTPVEESITMSVVPKIIPFKSTDGVYNIAYHVKFSNYQLKGMKLIKAEIINNSDNTVIKTYEDSILIANFCPASKPLPTEQEMTEGTGKLPNPFLLVWLRVNQSNLPSKILHKMTFLDTTGSNKQYTVQNVTEVSNQQPVVIGPPVKGKYWFLQNTTAIFIGGHFDGIASIKGVITCDGIFAADFSLADSTLTKRWKGDGSNVEDHFCYGQELYAVADGKVVHARDIYQNTKPFQEASPYIPMEHYCGNELVIDIGNGNYADYTHLKPGSIVVKEGDMVTKGQLVAQIGNSGHSTGPHLHFEICRSNPPYLDYGVPYVIDKFELYFIAGRGLTSLINQTFTNSIYEANSVVHFIF